MTTGQPPLEEALAGKYDIVRELGRGGMATVYLAHDRQHDRQVAIKVLHADLALTVGAERFLREVEIAARLTHPHILPLFTAGTEAGYLYYVMPYVTGETLRHRLDRESQLPVSEALRYAAEVADALAYAHEAGVVHRDIKPANVLFSGRHAIIADFGIAAVADVAPDDQLTRPGLAIGTPSYMAPEQIVGGVADARTDVYAVGCLLYEMLVGAPPLVGPTSAATLARRESEPIPSVRKARPTVTESLDTVLSRALAPLPADRFQTAAELRDALLALTGMAAAGEETTGRRRATRREPKMAPRQIAGRIGVAALVGLALAFGVLRIMGPAEAAGIRAVAVLPFAGPSGESGEEAYFSEGLTQDVRDGLSRAGGLTVASRLSSEKVVEEGVGVPGVRDQLQVEGVVEGSVLRTEDELRIAVNLTDARTGSRIWEHVFEGRPGDVFALRTAIVDSLRRALELETDPGAPPRAQATDVATHNIYLQARFAANDRTLEGLDRAVRLFEAAIERDSTYAPAWAGLASAHALIGTYEYRTWPEVSPAASHAATVAIQLDSTLSEAHSALGIINDYRHAWGAAERAYETAIRLNSNDARAHHWHAVSRTLSGRPDEAVPLIERARRLDPLSLPVNVSAGWVHYYRRDLATAEDRLQASLDMEPDSWIALLYMGLVDADLERFDEAVAALEQARSSNPEALVLVPVLAHVRALQGDATAARALLDEAVSMQAPRAWIAIAHLTLGERDAALDWLERAFAVGPWAVIEINTFWFEPLHEESRFQMLRTALQAGRDGS